MLLSPKTKCDIGLHLCRICWHKEIMAHTNTYLPVRKNKYDLGLLCMYLADLINIVWTKNKWYYYLLCEYEILDITWQSQYQNFFFHFIGWHLHSHRSLLSLIPGYLVVNKCHWRKGFFTCKLSFTFLTPFFILRQGYKEQLIKFWGWSGSPCWLSKSGIWAIWGLWAASSEICALCWVPSFSFVQCKYDQVHKICIIENSY